MANYGSAVSQKGYDVKTCADKFLVYSSAFQTLKIFNTYSVSTTIPSSGTNTIRINHNLGFIAPFIVIYNGSSRIGTAKSYFMCDSSGLSVGNKSSYTSGDSYNNVENKADSLTIDIDEYWDEVNSNVGDTVYFTVYIFLDNFSTIAERNINTGTSSGSSSSDYGIRISKAGYDVKTCADKDCILSSSYFSQIIHKKGIVTGELNASYNLSYIPMVLCYTKRGGDYGIHYSDLAELTSNNLHIYAYSDDVNYYIIFK